MRNLTLGHLRSPWCAPELVEQTKQVFFPRYTTSHLSTLSRVVSAARTTVLPPSGLKEVMPVFWKFSCCLLRFPSPGSDPPLPQTQEFSPGACQPRMAGRSLWVVLGHCKLPGAAYLLFALWLSRGDDLCPGEGLRSEWKVSKVKIVSFKGHVNFSFLDSSRKTFQSKFWILPGNSHPYPPYSHISLRCRVLEWSSSAYDPSIKGSSASLAEPCSLVVKGSPTWVGLWKMRATNFTHSCWASYSSHPVVCHSHQ